MLKENIYFCLFFIDKNVYVVINVCDILLLFATFSTYGYDLSSFFNSKFSVIKTMCTDIVDKWMEKVRGKNNENSGKQGMLNYLGMM